MFRHYLHGFERLIFPPVCWLCEQRVESLAKPGFCEDCYRSLIVNAGEYCRKCCRRIGPFSDADGGCSQCQGETFHYESAIRLGFYEGKLKDAILKGKHHSGESLIEYLAELWYERDRELFLELKIDRVVPIPLHWIRRMERGYNQSAALGRTLASRIGVPFGEYWLRRIKMTPKQFTQSATARRHNVKEAFRSTRRCSVTGLRILLVDDVLTTGATANEASKVLKRAGAAQVFVSVLAHH